MEFWQIIDKKSRIEVPKSLKHLLVNFTVACLIEKPSPVAPFAAEYFSDLVAKQHHSVDSSTGSIRDIFIPEDMPTRGRAKVVYSEPYNPETDTDSDDEVEVFPKTDEQKNVLLEVVKKCFLFRALDPEHLHRVINAMFPKDVQPGDYVIQQFDDGDNFYIIEYGLYDVLIADEPDGEPKHVFTYENEGNFGELALMYNMPRAASVKATTEGRLWAMNRTTFRRMVLKAAFKKRKMYERLLSSVHILQELTPYEKMNLADALVPKTFYEGDTIMNQGDDADGMYFVEKGRLSVSIYDPEADTCRYVDDLEEGAYFGELALLTNEPRAATVCALEDCKLAFLDRTAFERILGPCMDVMERQIGAYKDRRFTIFSRKSEVE